MKKLLPLFFLSAFLFLPQSAYAGLSEGCFPIVECDPGYDFYGGTCQAHIETLVDCGVPPAGKYSAFSCDAGCYVKSVPVTGPAPICPGGIDFSGNCLIKLDVLDDDVDVDSVGNAAFKIWDGANLTEMVHIGTAGCTDDQIAVSDAAELTGWKCEDKPLVGCADDQVAVADSGSPTGWSCAVGTVVGAVCADGEIVVGDVASPTGWSCVNSVVYLRDAIDGLIDVAEKLMTELGVAPAKIVPIIAALTDLADGTPTDLVTPLAGLVIPPISDDVIWAGVTSTSHDGKYANGYADADALCASNYASSRVCSVEEIMTLRHKGELPGSVGGDEKAWINGGPPGFNSAANDCAGWRINDTTASNAWGRYWWFGLNQGWADGCNLTHRFACCK